jgi:hypothetical protein
MGIFWETKPDEPSPLLVNNFAAALRTQPPADEATVKAQATESARAAATVTPPTTFNAQRFVMAVIIVAVLLIAGIVCNAQGWTDAEKTLFTLATTAFGVVTGLLAGKS